MPNPFAALYDPELDVGSRLERALIAVGSERKRQLTLQAAGRFSYTPSDHALTDAQRLAMLAEELGEVARNVLRRGRLVTDGDPSDAGLRKELGQVAAIAVAWMERL